MTQILNFQKMDVSGATKEEAMMKAPFEIMGDATQAYRSFAKRMTNGVNESNKREFMLDYLSKKSKNVPGVGFIITNDPAIANTKDRPYSIVDCKNEKGTRTYKTIYQLIDDATGAILAQTDGTKAEAKELARQLYTEKGFTGSVTCKYTKQVVNGEPIAFRATYSPSKKAKEGKYTVFGLCKF